MKENESKLISALNFFIALQSKLKQNNFPPHIWFGMGWLLLAYMFSQPSQPLKYIHAKYGQKQTIKKIWCSS